MHVDIAHFIEFTFNPLEFCYDIELMQEFLGRMINKIPINGRGTSLSFNHHFHHRFMQVSTLFHMGECNACEYSKFIKYMMYPAEHFDSLSSQGYDHLISLWECKHSIALGRTYKPNGGSHLFFGTHSETFRIKSIDPIMQPNRNAYPLYVYTGVEELDMFFRLVFNGIASIHRSEANTILTEIDSSVIKEIVNLLKAIIDELRVKKWFNTYAIPKNHKPYKASNRLLDKLNKFVTEQVKPLLINSVSYDLICESQSLINGMEYFINSLRSDS